MSSLIAVNLAIRDAETMLSTFTNPGLAPEDERGSQQGYGSISEMVLAAFDHLGNYYEGGPWRRNEWHGRLGRGKVQRRNHGRDGRGTREEPDEPSASNHEPRAAKRLAG